MSAGAGNGGEAVPVVATSPKKGPSGSPAKEAVIALDAVGRTPLLMQAMSEETIINVLIRKQRPPIKTDLPLEVMAEKCLYVNPDGSNKPGIPATNLFACLREAGRFVKIDARRSVSTAESTLLPSFLSIEEPFLLLTGGGGWKPDVRRGQMGQGAKKVTVGIVRPLFNTWGFKVTLAVDLTDVTLDTVRKLVEVAGRRVGLCGFRPEKNGPFGQFTIANWEVVTDK